MTAALGQTDNISRPNSKPAAVLGVDGVGDELPNNALVRLGSIRFRHPEPVLDLAIAPNGKTIVTIGSQYLIAWETKTGKRRWTASNQAQKLQLPSTGLGLQAIAFSDDNLSFYTPGQPHQILKWITLTGEVTKVDVAESLPLTAHNRPVGSFPGSLKSIDISADSRQLVVAGSHGLAMCDARGKVSIELPNKPAGAVNILNSDKSRSGGHYCYAKLLDQQLLVHGSAEPKILQLVNPSSGQVEHQLGLAESLVRFTSAPQTADSKVAAIYCSEADGALRAYDTYTGSRIWELNSNEQRDQCESFGVAVSPNGKRVAYGTRTGYVARIVVVDAESGKEICRFLAASETWGIAFQDDTTLVAAGNDGLLQFWNIDYQSSSPVYGIRRSNIIAATHDGQRFAVADASQTVQVLNRLGQIDKQEVKLSFMPTHLKFTADGRNLICLGRTDTESVVGIWELETQKKRWQHAWPCPSHVSFVMGDVSADDQLFAFSPDESGRILLIRISDGEKVSELSHPAVKRLAFQGSNKLVSCSCDNSVRVWDVGNEKLLHDWALLDKPKAMLSRPEDLRKARLPAQPKSSFEITDFAVSPTSDQIVFSLSSGVIETWSLQGEQRTKFSALVEHPASRLGYSPDGKWLAIALKNQVRLLDAESGRIMWSLDTQHPQVTNIVFSSDGKKLLTSGSDQMGYWWNLDFDQHKDFYELWSDLADSNQPVWSYALRGPEAAEFVHKRFKQVQVVLNSQSILNGLDATRRRERERLLEQLVLRDESVDLDSRLQRAAWALRRISETSTAELLEQLDEAAPAKLRTILSIE